MREAFAADTDPAPAGCPPAESIWMAVARELPTDDRRAIVRHTAECGSCADAWRLAHAAMASEGLPRASAEAAPAWRSMWVMGPGLAAAALLVIGVFIDRPFDTWRSPGPSTTLRDAPEASVQPLVADGAVLDRQALVLRWAPRAEGTRYDVRVATADLTIVSQAFGLTETAYTVPAEAVASLPADTRLFWQVTAVAADQARVTSPAFTVVIR
jgi:hypothetical protein